MTISNFPTQFVGHAVAAQTQAMAIAANATLHPAAYFQFSFIKNISIP